MNSILNNQDCGDHSMTECDRDTSMRVPVGAVGRKFSCTWSMIGAIPAG